MVPEMNETQFKVEKRFIFSKNMNLAGKNYIKKNKLSQIKERKVQKSNFSKRKINFDQLNTDCLNLQHLKYPSYWDYSPVYAGYKRSTPLLCHVADLPNREKDVNTIY